MRRCGPLLAPITLALVGCAAAAWPPPPEPASSEEEGWLQGAHYALRALQARHPQLDHARPLG